MNIFRHFSLSIKHRAIILLLLYILGTIGFLTMYSKNNSNSLLFNSILFVILILIGRIANGFSINPKRMLKYLYISEICFAIYLGLIIFFKEDYLSTYKLLYLPSVIISIVQCFLFKKVENK
jgi:hypothetical protein